MEKANTCSRHKHIAFFHNFHTNTVYRIFAVKLIKQSQRDQLWLTSFSLFVPFHVRELLCRNNTWPVHRYWDIV